MRAGKKIPQTGYRKKRTKKIVGTVGLHVLIAAISLAFAFPLLWIFMTSFKTPREYYRMPPKLLPNQLVIFHYKEAFAPWTIDPTELSEATYYIEESAGRVESVVPNIGNSLIIITGAVGLALLVGIWAAYALSRFSFRGSTNMGVWILSTRMMPPIVIAIPLFWVMRRIHLTGTHLGLIMIYVMIQLPFVIWMMKGFFDEIPRSIEESVLVDGGNRATVMFKVVIPLAIPGIVATALFCIFLTWTEFLFASVFTNSSSATLPVVLSWFRQDRGILWGQMSAVMVVALLPLMTITMVLQRKMIRGLTAGAIR
jgi:multiple sugar transport system permease protein